MRELREDTFSGNKDEDAHDHIDRVLNIVGLFNIMVSYKDEVMLEFFPLLFPVSAKRWVEQDSSPGNIQYLGNLLKRLLSKGFHEISDNFAYNKMCPDWYGTDPITGVTDGCVSVYMVGSASHMLSPDLGFYNCPLNEEVKQVEEVRYGEFRRTTPFNGNNGGKFHVGPPGYYTKTDNRPLYGKKRQSLEELLTKHQEESAQRSTEMEVLLEVKQKSSGRIFDNIKYLILFGEMQESDKKQGKKGLKRTMAGVDVDTLTMEQYLALSRENQEPGVDLLKKAFIQRYCPPSMTTKQLEDIHNFKQEGDESLYQAWERYNDLLYKCPTHDINSHQKVNIFYMGLSTMNRQLLDSQGPIPKMRPAEALTAIQTMADHSQKWHDGTTSKNIESSSSKDGLVALVNKLDNLGRDMKKLKESVHAITYFLHVKMV
ncbi:hypothetical protein Tco_0295555 [Tanacetum coccineum]